MRSIYEGSKDYLDPALYEEKTPEKDVGFFEYESNDPSKMSYEEFENSPERQKKAETVMNYAAENLDGKLSKLLGSNLFGTDPFEKEYDITTGKQEYSKRDIERVQDLFRQEGWTTTGGFQSSAWLKDAPKEIQDAYNSLKDDWQNKVENKDLLETMGSIFRNTQYAVGDPLNFLGIGAAKLAGQASLNLSSKMSNQKMKHLLTWLAASNTNKANYARMAGAGFGWGTLANTAQQSVDVATNLQTEYDQGEQLVSGALGAAAGPVIYKGAQSAKKLIQYALENKVTNSNIKLLEHIRLEDELDSQINKETGAMNSDTISEEQLRNMPDIEYKDDIIEAATKIETIAAQQQRPEKASLKDKREARRARDASRQKLLEDKENFAYGGWTADEQKQLENIIEQKEYTKFIEDTMDYEANRDIPDFNNEHDYYLIKEVGEIFYNNNKARQSKEYHLQSLRHYMANREKFLPKGKSKEEVISENKQLQVFIDEATEKDTVEPPQEILTEAKKFIAKVGGGETTEKEVADAMLAASNGDIAPDNLKATLAKIAQRFHGKYAFGRPTKFLTKFDGQSKTAIELAKKIRYDSNEGFFESSQLVDQDFNETWQRYAGKYSVRLMEALDDLKYYGGDTKDKLYNRVKDTILSQTGQATKAQENLVQGMRRGEDFNLDDKAKKAAISIRSILDDILKEQEDLGIITDKGRANYLPRLWNRETISEDFYGRSRVPWTASERKELKGQGENNFAKLLIEDGEAANLIEANDIIEGMLTKNIQDGGSEKAGVGNAFFTARIFNNIIDDSKYSQFLDNNIENTMFAYITQAANSYTRKKVLGVTSAGEFEKKWVDKIKQEVLDSGNDFTSKDKEDILNLYNSITGDGINDFDNVVFRTARDAYTTGTRTATLPFATLSSLPEVLLNIRTVGSKETLASVEEAFGSWSEKVGNTRKRLAGEQGLTDPEIFHEMREFNMIVDNAAISAADRLADSAISNRGFRIANNLYFKTILLEQWTKFAQMASFITGKKLIAKNLKAIADHGSSTPTKRIKAMRTQLAALGVKVDEGVAFINRNNGEINKKDPFYNDVKTGAARYTRTVIMDNNPRSALKPMFMSDPKTAWLFELMGYPTAFTNKVLKDMARGTVQYAKNPEHAAQIVAGSLIMTASAMGINQTRAYIQGRDLSDKSFLDNAIDGFTRNGFIPVLGESINRAKTTYEFSGQPIRALGELGGPAVSDAARMAAYGNIWSVIGPRFVPGYYAMSEEKRQDVDNFFEDIGKTQKKSPYAKGGVVTNVDQVPTEPDERIDKMTGLPYDIQAGEAYVDVEERDVRKVYNIGGAVAKAATPFVMELVDSIMSAVTRNNRKVTRQSAVNVAQDIEKHYIGKEGEFGDVPSILDDPDYRKALNLNVQSLIDEKEGLSKYDPVAQMPTGEEFSKARGYTPEQIEIFRQSNEATDNIKADYGDMADDVNYLSYKLDTIGARDDSLSWDKKLTEYIEELNLNNREFKSRGITKELPEYNSKLILNILESEPEHMELAKEIFSSMPRSLSWIKTTQEYRLPKKQKEENLKSFLSSSKVKHPVYRAKGHGNNFDYDEAFAFPFETGAHFGTKGQAERIALEHITDNLYYSKEPIIDPTVPKERREQIKKQLESFLDRVDFRNLTFGKTTELVSDPSRLGTEIKPVTMTKGYVQLKNPLIITHRDFASNSSAQNFGSVINEAVLEALERQIGGLPLEIATKWSAFKNKRDKLEDKFIAIEDRGAEPGRAYNKNYDNFISSLYKAKINKDFREMLQKLGFDGIQYFNTIDTPSGVPQTDARMRAGEISPDFPTSENSPWSYIIFEPGQFKQTNATDFDVSNPRPTFATGGKVAGSLQKKINKRKAA